MLNQFASFFKNIVPLTVSLFLIQHFIISKLFNNVEFLFSTSTIYIFHFILTSLVFVLLVISHKKNPDHTGFAFLGGSILKMMAAVIFILIATSNNLKMQLQDYITFFIPYFFFLFIETYFAIKLLNYRKK